jgi:hypothetical protein
MDSKRTGSPVNIHVVENFLNKEEIELFKILVATQEWHRAGDPNSSVYILDRKEELCNHITSLGIKERVTELASYSFGMNLSLVDNMGGFQMRKPGDSMRVHTDAENFDGESHMEEVLHLNFAKAMTMYVALLYLGEEFGEGQLYFPHNEIDINVKPGDLVMFPTSNRYPHGVRESTYGNRCVFSLYFTRKRLHDAYMDMFRLVSTHSDYAKDK